VAAEPSPDRAIDGIARLQHGAFNRAQARTAGFTDSMVAHRLRTGSWLRLAPAVYALASHPFTWERQAMTATLCLSGAVLAGRSAAALHRIDGFRKGRLEVAVAPGRPNRSSVAVVRRTPFVQATQVDRIPTLTVVDTLLSLAGYEPLTVVDRAVDAVIARHPSALGRLEDRFVTFAAGRRKGSADMRRILVARGEGYVPPTSELERLLRAMLDTPVLPPFDHEVPMPWWPDGGGRVDAYNAPCRLIVEGDGRAWHTRERDFVHDRRRDNLATANGHAVLRFTWSDLVERSEESRKLVRTTAAARGWPTPG
jgi:hypothetical protein